MSPEDFVSAIRVPVRQAMPSAIGMARAMVLAHAAYESGWGESKAFVKGNNLFNLTRTRGEIGAVIEGSDTEYDSTGRMRLITQRFAAYISHRASVEHYLRFISHKRYQPALTQLLDGDTAFIATLRDGDGVPAKSGEKKGGFFTLPLEKYRNGYLSTLRTVNDVLESITQP